MLQLCYLKEDYAWILLVPNYATFRIIILHLATLSSCQDLRKNPQQAQHWEILRNSARYTLYRSSLFLSWVSLHLLDFPLSGIQHIVPLRNHEKVSGISKNHGVKDSLKNVIHRLKSWASLISIVCFHYSQQAESCKRIFHENIKVGPV